MSSKLGWNAQSVESSSISVEASFIGGVAASRLRGASGSGSVHSVYGSAINILYAGGIVSLVPDWLERGVINVTLMLKKSGNLLSFNLKKGDPVERRGTTVVLGDGRLSISMRNARLHTPHKKFSLPLLSAERVRQNLVTLKAATLASGRLAGLGGLIALIEDGGIGAPNVNLNKYSEFALPRILSLISAIRTNNSSAVKQSAGELIGLGPGLTPSSDDMLSGMMLMMVLHAKNAKRNEHSISRITHAIASESRGRTTLLSQEYLMQASKGNGNESAMRLCKEVFTGRADSVRAEAEHVLMIGESSGSDTALGIMLGAWLALNWKAK